VTAFTRENLERYLHGVLEGDIHVESVAPLRGGSDVKGYGYGVPLLVDFTRGGIHRRAVVETMAAGPFGHEHPADRAAAPLWAHDAFNRLPRHVRSLDVGAVRRQSGLVSLGDAREFFVLTEFVEGRGYFEDLVRLKLGGSLREIDRARCDALADYLAQIHARRGGEPGLYVRRLRELLGHGECIMGLTDSYPVRHGFITSKVLEEIEHRCLAWRWKLKNRAHRLRQVHGDFHPWNILFREGTDFTALDRSRGEWGEPADDVTCLSLNYLFFSLQAKGGGRDALLDLFRRFWARYLKKTQDRQILEVAAPFFAFRGLVMASPVWYPKLDEEIRGTIFTFIDRVLGAVRFEPGRVKDYLHGD
jgi:hypothetical protein